MNFVDIVKQKEGDEQFELDESNKVEICINDIDNCLTKAKTKVNSVQSIKPDDNTILFNDICGTDLCSIIHNYVKDFKEYGLLDLKNEIDIYSDISKIINSSISINQIVDDSEDEDAKDDFEYNSDF